MSENLSASPLDLNPQQHTHTVPSSRQESLEEIIVDWDGPEDPYNPKNWSVRQRWSATIIVSLFTFVTPVSSSMIAPASPQLAEEFGITSTVIIAMTTSIFLLAYSVGPLFIGPMSEIYGRSRVLQIANLWYLAWNLACGFAVNTSQILGFRFLAGLGGSAPLAIAGAVIGDCWKPEERGKAMALFSLAPLLGPVIGPLCGSWIAEKSTWRWVFWSTSILDAAIQVVGFFVLEETYAPVLLERKAARIRQSMSSDTEKGPQRDVRTVYETGDRMWKKIMATALTRPFLMMYSEPIVQLVGLYSAFVYGQLYLFLTTMPSIFEGVYGMKPGIAGLHYLALGVGLTGASQINARNLDKIYRYYTEKNGGAGRPEYRLPPILVGTTLMPIGLLITGWTVQNKVHWIVPNIGIAIVGAGIILNHQCTQTYIIDSFGLYSASGLAAVAFLRSLAAFGFPLFAPSMYKALGFGVGDTILAAVGTGIGFPALWLFWFHGERIRNSSTYGKKG